MMYTQSWIAKRLYLEWKRWLHLCIILFNYFKNTILSPMEALTLPKLASPASTRSSMELTLLEGWDLASDLEANPNVWWEKATTALCYAPIIATCIKHKMHVWIRWNYIHHFQCPNHEVSFIFPCPYFNHLSLKPRTLKGIDRATHPPAPTSDEEKLTSLRRGPWHHHSSMAAPCPPWEPEPQRDSLPTQCSESWSNQGV